MRNYRPKTVRPAPEHALDPLVQAVSAAYDVPVRDLCGRTRARWAAWPRQTLYLMAGELFAWRSPRVAKVLKLDTNTVEEGRKAAKHRIQSDAAEHLKFRRAMNAYVQACVMGVSE